MSLLAPLFLLGALVVAGPIIAHLVRRNTRSRVMFSATQFLEPSAPRLDRRNRIQHPWLLLLRCLAVLILAAGFARPFLRETPVPLGGATPVRHRVIVLDESASMQRAGLWDAALGHVRAAASDLAPGDALAVVSAGRSPAVLLSGDRWMHAAPAEREAALDTIIGERRPGWEAAHLDTALDRALEELAAMRETARAPGESSIVVISDFAEGTRLSGLAGREWPQGVHVRLESVARPDEPNAAVHWLGWTTTPDGERMGRVHVWHDAFDSRAYRLALHAIDDGRELEEPVELLLAPRESRAIPLPFPPGRTAPVRVELTGDTVPFDNTLWVAPPAPRRFTLAYWGDGDTDDPGRALFYVSRAVRGWREPAMTVQPDSAAAARDAAPLHLVTRELAPGETAAIRAQLEAGATALVLAPDAAMAATAGALAREPGWTARGGPAGGHALFGSIAFAHPLFAPFADPRYSDFTRVRFWKAPHLEPPAESAAVPVARFDSVAPAVLEVPIGRGSLVIWAGDWTPASSQWVLSTKFVPWFQALARRAAGGPPAPTMAEVGDAAALGLTGDVRAPAHPGVFTVGSGATARAVALNVPAIESRTNPLPLDAWEQLGVPLAPERGGAMNGPESARAGSVAASRIESEQQLWRWMLVAGLAVLAVESLAAFRASTRRSNVNPA